MSFVLGLPQFTRADVIYMQGKDDLVLWKYNTSTHAFTQVGVIRRLQESTNTFSSLYMVDIASGPDGMLYGLGSGFGELYKIDPLTAIAEYVGHTNVGVSMTFMPGGRAFIYGGVSGQPASLVEIDIETGAQVSFVPVGAPASGDLAYDPIKNVFLLSSPSGSPGSPDRVLEIHPESGATNQRGHFPNKNIWGFDILSDSNTIVACSGTEGMSRLNRLSNSNWISNMTWTTPFEGCLGATRYLCEKPARFTINSRESSLVEIRCGDPIFVDAALAGEGGHYTWEVSGTTPDGAPFFWETSGTGNPGAFNLNQVPGLQGLSPQFEAGAPRRYLVTLKRWCTTNEVIHQKTIEVVMKPSPVSWEVRSNRMYFGETLHALDTGTPGRTSGRFDYDYLQDAVGFDFFRDLPISDVGFHPITYTVTRQNGCTSQRTETVQVVHESVFIPNAFTPNGDTHNDTFDIVLADPASMEFVEIQIFNRWGALVYSSQSLMPVWDGRTGGLDAPSGVYVYVLKTKTKRGAFDERRGQITLFR